MQLSVKGKQIDVGEALRGHVRDQLGAAVEKYAGRAIEGHAVFSREAHLINCEISIHFGRDLIVQAAGGATEAYAAFDQALDRAAARLRRYKRRLRDHHHGRDRETEGETLAATTYLLAAESGEEGEDATATGDAPVIVAETATEIPSLSVSEAVMRMDLADLPALVFRNRASGVLNVVYRRTDGHIGWVDPALAPVKRQKARS
jgi:ribosomal subunit interface protein